MGTTNCEIVLVVIYALQSLGLPIRNVNNENNQDEGFFYRTPMALKNGARQGTYRREIQSSFSEVLVKSEITNLPPGKL